MNYIKQLTYFFNKAAADPDFTSTHLSLFIALFQLWNQARFAKTIQIIRDDAMRLGKINSKATYHKTMAYLHKQAYIDYRPSYNPFKGSTISFFPENPIQASLPSEPVQILTTRPPNEPYIDSNTISNHVNSKYLLIDREKNDKQKSVASRNEPVSLPKISENSPQEEKSIPPFPREVESFFLTEKSTEQEAQRFINHYTANGWLVGGKSPMKDWKASAKNWISNSINFNSNTNYGKPNRAQQLNANTRKNYFEPL